MEALGVRTMATTASGSASDRGLAMMAAGRPLGGIGMGQCAMVAIGNIKGSTSNELRLGSGLHYQRTSFLPQAGLLRRTQRGENVSRKGGLIVVEASASSSSPGDEAVGAGDAGSGLEAAQAGVGTSELAATLKLGSLFGLWYLFNIYFNIYNKQAWQNHHKIFPAQVIICIFCLFDLGRWCARLHWSLREPWITSWWWHQ